MVSVWITFERSPGLNETLALLKVSLELSDVFVTSSPPLNQSISGGGIPSTLQLKVTESVSLTTYPPTGAEKVIIGATVDIKVSLKASLSLSLSFSLIIDNLFLSCQCFDSICTNPALRRIIIEMLTR